MSQVRRISYPSYLINPPSLHTGLEVTRFPGEEMVSLETDHRPLVLSYVVCGHRAHLQRFRIKLTVSQENIGGGDITLKRNTPLVYDSVAENRGISASLWNMTSQDYEMCIEVPVRVWPDHPKVQDSTIELKLGIRLGRIPRVYPGGKFHLFTPEKVIETTVSEYESQHTTPTDSSTADYPTTQVSSSDLYLLQSPEQNSTLICKCNCSKNEK
jgi:hypothetical protein